MPIINTVIAGGGTTPTGTKSITANGVYDVTAYASADVQVPSSAPTYYLPLSNVNGKLTKVGTLPNLTGITDLGNYAFYSYYKGTSVVGAVDLSSLTRMSGTKCCESMFEDCRQITSVDLSSLTRFENCASMFKNCSVSSIDLSSLTSIAPGIKTAIFEQCPLTSVDMSKVETIGTIDRETTDQEKIVIFSQCSLTTIDLSSLKQALGYVSLCSQCSSLTTVKLDSLEYVSDMYYSGSFGFPYTAIVRQDFPSLYKLGVGAFEGAFSGCSNLQSIYFYALSDVSEITDAGDEDYIFEFTLNGCSGVTVHFPKNMQSVMSSWSGIVSGLGGTNTTVLFDLITSVTGANSTTYTRKQKNSTSTATAWVNNDVLYYTSGTNEPMVGDTIYSDDACTTAVTTISAIA